MNYELGIRDKGAGFTLIEFLIYMALTSIVLGAVAIFVTILLQVQAKNNAIVEVEENGVFVNSTLQYYIRNSRSIITPPAAAQGSSLSIEPTSPTDNPTIFSVVNNVLVLKKGSASDVPISSSAVRVTNIAFQNVSTGTSNKSIKYSYTLSHINPSGRNEYSFSKTFNGSVNIK
jgi:type II secretory pathway pseudopilin PulG